MNSEAEDAVDSTTRNSADDHVTEGRRRLNPSKDHRLGKIQRVEGQNSDRWHTHKKTEDYVNTVGEIMYPHTEREPFGYNLLNGEFPLTQMNTLGYLLNPLRRKQPLEKWNPFEVAVFEASITLYGKNFPRIQTNIKTKSTQEIIEFYYMWKKTTHYQQWKKSYVPDERDTPVLLMGPSN